MQSLETKSSRPRPKSFETETRPETFETNTETETSKNGSRDSITGTRHWSRRNHRVTDTFCNCNSQWQESN